MCEDEHFGTPKWVIIHEDKVAERLKQLGKKFDYSDLYTVVTDIGVKEFFFHNVKGTLQLEVRDGYIPLR